MSKGHRITDAEAEALYNAHVEECKGYPVLTQADFYDGTPAVEELSLEEVEDYLFLQYIGVTDEAQGNNGW